MNSLDFAYSSVGEMAVKVKYSFKYRWLLFLINTFFEASLVIDNKYVFSFVKKWYQNSNSVWSG